MHNSKEINYCCIVRALMGLFALQADDEAERYTIKKI